MDLQILMFWSECKRHTKNPEVHFQVVQEFQFKLYSYKNSRQIHSFFHLSQNLTTDSYFDLQNNMYKIQVHNMLINKKLMVKFG